MSGYPPPYPAGDASYGGAPPPYTPYPSAPPTQAYGGQPTGSYAPAQQASYAGQQAPQGGGGHGSGHSVQGVGNFLKDNMFQVGTAAFNYKMGGGLGKMFAAGQTAHLANKYSKNHEYYNQPKPDKAPGAAHSSTGMGTSSKGLTHDLLNTGKTVLAKAEKVVGKTVTQIKQKTDAHPHQQQQQYGQPQQLQTGARVQLVSSKTGGTVQIVQGNDGRLVVDAKGAHGPQTYNAIWTVFRGQDGAVAFSNNGNYMSVSGRVIIVQNLGATTCPPVNCLFQIQQSYSGVILVPVLDFASVLDVDSVTSGAVLTQDRNSMFNILYV